MFLYFFILNVISNFVLLDYDHSIWAFFCMVSCAGLVAFIENYIISCINNKFIANSLLVLFAFLHSLVILVDYFLLFNFNLFLNQDIIDILSETNANQAKDFILAYLQWWKIVIWLLIIVLLNIIALYINSKGNDYLRKIFTVAIAIMGITVLFISVYSFTMYKNGLSVPQYIAPVRLSYSVFVLKQRIHSIRALREICHDVKASTDIEHAPSIILVIGESFSKYHCSLYGYEKNTFPLLEARKDSGELLVMDDVVAVADATHRNMKAIFSLGGDDSDFESSPLFPACFMKAGYMTKLYDNQYFLGQGITFLSDIELNRDLFSFRNNESYKFDGDMIRTIQKEDCPTLYVVHLWGQHYAYENRYPLEFAMYNENDYVGDKHSLIKAHYDNANLYNDYVINEIIGLFENDDAIMIYFSDHGEEVYELGNLGHGFSTSSKDIRFQLSVPFIVWTSNGFRTKHPSVYNKLKNSENVPIMTQDVSHVLLDIAQIHTSSFNEKRSFINSSYDINKRRIVMHSMDYDERVKNIHNDNE